MLLTVQDRHEWEISKHLEALKQNKTKQGTTNKVACVHRSQTFHPGTQSTPSLRDTRNIHENAHTVWLHRNFNDSGTR